LAVVLSVVARLGVAAEPDVNKQTRRDSGENRATASRNQALSERMSDAWKTIWSRFHHPPTNQFFTKEPSRLPNAERVKRLDPNECGYGTGMDDGPLFGGILLVAICDRYDVTHDASLKPAALSVFKGLELCATVHGVPGFVARGVCPEDGKSIYITSSRDQYTHLAHGLWRYYHSALCDKKAKNAIRKILHAVADRMTRNVTPENNFDFLRADGSQDPRGICRMLDVRTHEAARLPMLYAAAWDVGRKQEHFRLCRKYLPQAIQQSLKLPDLPQAEIRRWIPAYSVLQMQCSLEVLHAVERDPAMRSQISKAMRWVAEFAANKRVFAARKRGPSFRECGETALAQFMFADLAFTEQQETELAGAILGAKYPVDPCAAYCLLGAYWKARVRGLFQP